MVERRVCNAEVTGSSPVGSISQNIFQPNDSRGSSETFEINMHPIKHIWFDFADTIAFTNQEHDRLLYQTYADVTTKPVSPELIQEFKELYKQYKSNSAVFTTYLGLPPGYWAKAVEATDVRKLHSLAEPLIPDILNKLRAIVPISIFSNMRMDKLAPAIGIDVSWFTHILSGAVFKNPKPALDGFLKIVEISELPAENILFVGDSVDKEMIPAKKVGMMTCLMWNKSLEADYSFNNFENILDLVKN